MFLTFVSSGTSASIILIFFSSPSILICISDIALLSDSDKTLKADLARPFIGTAKGSGDLASSSGGAEPEENS